jgi:hypothetical protein
LKKDSCKNRACSERGVTWQTDAIGFQKCDLGLRSHFHRGSYINNSRGAFWYHLILNNVFLLSLCLSWPPLWSSGQGSWLQIQRSKFDSWGYQIFWEVVGLQWGPLSLVRITKELLQGNCGSGL